MKEASMYQCVHFIRFDAELNAARDETSQERTAKEQLAREKATMKADMETLQQEMNVSCWALNKNRINLCSARQYIAILIISQY